MEITDLAFKNNRYYLDKMAIDIPNIQPQQRNKLYIQSTSEIPELLAGGTR